MTALRLLSIVAIGFTFAAPDAVAQSWPAKPLRAIVPFAAGSSTDIVPRIVLEQLSPQLGQSIVVENRAGAGGTLGTAFVASSDPDGYALLASGSSHTIAPALYAKLNYDPVRDFAPVIPFGISPNVLVVSPAKGFKTAADLVAAMKAKPGTFNFSSVGIGTATHLSAERFLTSAGVKAVHIPFKGGAEAMSEVIAGRVDFFFGPPALVLPHVRERTLTALVVNGANRTAALTDIPTTLEAGFKDAEYPIWYGLFVPAKTSIGVIERLHDETLKSLQTAKVREKLAALVVDRLVMKPAEFAAFVRKEVDLNAAVVKAAGVKPN
jgi:tripartite-type tricarboxylate transporter receptor subunit TctC